MSPAFYQLRGGFQSGAVQRIAGQAGFLRHLAHGVLQTLPPGLQLQHPGHPVLQDTGGSVSGSAPATTSTYSPLGAFSR